MYDENEVLYHAYKIIMARDDQLMHAHPVKRAVSGMSTWKNKDIAGTLKGMKDDQQYNKAWETENSGAIEDYLLQRCEYYVRNMPKNISGILESQHTNANGNYSPSIQKAADNWIADTKVKIQDELHRKFNTPRNPYMTQIINDFYDARYIENSLSDIISKHYY